MVVGAHSLFVIQYHFRGGQGRSKSPAKLADHCSAALELLPLQQVWYKAAALVLHDNEPPAKGSSSKNETSIVLSWRLTRRCTCKREADNPDLRDSVLCVLAAVEILITHHAELEADLALRM